MKTTIRTHKLTIMALMTAILLIFSFTPIGTIPIGPLSVSLNVIPVAIAAIAVGPAGGAAAGAIFGILSFLQCIGIGVPSGMGVILFGINPFYAFLQRFIPRLLEGFFAGLIFKALRRKNITFACAVTGFCTAFLNTLFFMSALILLFGSTDYVQGLVGGRNLLLFVCAFVGINAVVEMIVATIVSSAVGTALFKAKILQ